jgi:hypothetical protein
MVYIFHNLLSICCCTWSGGCRLGRYVEYPRHGTKTQGQGRNWRVLWLAVIKVRSREDEIWRRGAVDPTSSQAASGKPCRPGLANLPRKGL